MADADLEAELERVKAERDSHQQHNVTLGICVDKISARAEAAEARLAEAAPLIRSAADFIAEERDAIFQSHQVNGTIVISDDADQAAADNVADLDAWMLRARAFLTKTKEPSHAD